MSWRCGCRPPVDPALALLLLKPSSRLCRSQSPIGGGQFSCDSYLGSHGRGQAGCGSNLAGGRGEVFFLGQTQRLEDLGDDLLADDLGKGALNALGELIPVITERIQLTTLGIEQQLLKSSLHVFRCTVGHGFARFEGGGHIVGPVVDRT
ncbi:hypothetical protein Dace_0035 [Desulfuromonas acetoxidans DSM 684]|uniref:Uncharacterized protein n=1 Tax=Desulfuromonas acetoxidans (strain DSM 684 / 11070) TaxID=281689 RepID=Q1JVA0_DESA6|nr:hypothetical protein Dace_0035 [Desulfuromonas acetoxidans DSM 684]